MIDIIVSIVLVYFYYISEINFSNTKNEYIKRSREFLFQKENQERN